MIRWLAGVPKYQPEADFSSQIRPVPFRPHSALRSVLISLSLGEPVEASTMASRPNQRLRKGKGMSGGGGGGPWRPEVTPPTTPGPSPGGGPTPTPADPCDIVELTTINSPNRTVITGLRAGDELEVVFDPGPPQRLIARTAQGIAGSITSRMMLQIIQCIGQGYQYVAEVLSVNGAICQVRIHPR
jgi:hypothetical protein